MTSLLENKVNGSTHNASNISKAFIAGSFSGTITTIIFQPLDVLKTQFQRSCNDKTGHIGYRYVFRSLRNGEHNILYLWRGLTPSLIRCVPGVGLYFSTLHFLTNNLSVDPNGVWQGVMLGAVSRSFSVLSLMPATVIKTRIESGEYAYKGVIDAARCISKGEGYRGFFRGTFATVARDAPFSGIYLMFYTQMKNTFDYKKEQNSVTIFMCGLTSGCLASVVTHPADVVKTKMQLYPNHFNRLSFGIYFIYQKYGLRGFMKGLTPRLLRRTLITAMTWTVYEKMSNYFKIQLRKTQS